MKSKILFGISFLFGAMMINSGLNKFLNYMAMEMPEAATSTIEAFIASGWLWPLIALVEIVAGILFIIPKTRALGAVMILPIVVGIVLFNIALSPSTLPLALVFLAINGWVIWENKNKYLPMLNA